MICKSSVLWSDLWTRTHCRFHSFSAQYELSHGTCYHFATNSSSSNSWSYAKKGTVFWAVSFGVWPCGCQLLLKIYSERKSFRHESIYQVYHGKLNSKNPRRNTTSILSTHWSQLFVSVSNFMWIGKLMLSQAFLMGADLHGDKREIKFVVYKKGHLPFIVCFCADVVSCPGVLGEWCTGEPSVYQIVDVLCLLLK